MIIKITGKRSKKVPKESKMSELKSSTNKISNNNDDLHYPVNNNELRTLHGQPTLNVYSTNILPSLA